MILFVVRRLALENKIWRGSSNSTNSIKENFLPLSRANEGNTCSLTRKHLSSVWTSPNEIPKDGFPNDNDRILGGNSRPMVKDMIHEACSS